ncbi:MAG: hypothetical protein R3C14_08290 [Caldilineaceae bacterium]
MKSLKTLFGPIALFGSGETSPAAQRIHQRVMEQLQTPIQAAIIETPAGFEPNAAAVAQKIADYLQHRLQNFNPTCEQVAARKRNSAYSPDDPAIAAPIWRANYLFMGPGSPTYTVRQLTASYTWHSLVARHRLGAALCFSSAATIAIGKAAMPVYEIYKVGEDLHWKPGLDFFAAYNLDLVLVPHWNNNDGGADLDTSHCYLGTERYNQLVDLLPATTAVLGIEENTGVIIDPKQGECEVVGAGAACVIHNGQERRFVANDHFPVTALGDWCLPAAEEGIPAAIWQRGQEALAEGAPKASSPEAPAAILALVEERTQARTARDWSKADQIRDQLAELGWQVNDTPDGATVSPRS